MKNIFKIIISISLIYFIFLNTKAQDIGVTSNLTMDWEVLNSYTPPFYEGKPLPGEAATIKVVATPEIKTPAGSFDNSKLFYSWEINDMVSHIYTKTAGNILIFPLDILTNDNVVNLKVYTSNKLETLLIEKTIHIYAKQVKGILYKDLNNPILTYANAINKRYQDYNILPNDSFSIIAEPYYFSTQSPNDNIDYTWSLNDITGNIDNENNIFNFNPDSKTLRGAKIGLNIENSNESLQSDEENVSFTINNS